MDTSSCHTPSGDSPHIWTDMKGQELKPARDESCALGYKDIHVIGIVRFFYTINVISSITLVVMSYLFEFHGFLNSAVFQRFLVSLENNMNQQVSKQNEKDL